MTKPQGQNCALAWKYSIATFTPPQMSNHGPLRSGRKTIHRIRQCSEPVRLSPGLDRETQLLGHLCN
jgi:hypothetical protein